MVDRRAQRSTEPSGSPHDRPQVVLELAGLGALDRPVPGVVHARGDLVGEQPVADLEQLQRQHADVVEPVQQQPRVALGLLLQLPASAPGPARGVTRRMPSRWWFSTSG